LLAVQGESGLFLYDGASRIVSASRGTHNASFEYDPFGTLSSLRITDGAVERRETFYGPISQTAFFDASGKPINVGPPGEQLHSFTERSIVTPAGSLAAVRRSNTGARVVLFPFGESQGARGVFDGNGAIKQTISYDAYGAVVADSGNPASLTWWPYQWNGGHVLDGLQLTAIGQRVLDSSTGRFLQRDGSMVGASSFGLHPYAFAGNNPVEFLDVEGAQPEPSRETAIGASFSGIGLLLKNYDFVPGKNIEPEIHFEWACGPQRDCIKIVDEAYGTTPFEEVIRKEYHAGGYRGISFPGSGGKYHVITDKNSGAVIGYAFVTNAIDIYDREGRVLKSIPNEGSMECFQPTDLIGGPRAFLGRRLVQEGAKDTAKAVERRLAVSLFEEAETTAAVRLRKPPPFTLKRGIVSKGYTDEFGNIFINKAHFNLDADAMQTVFHEGVHRFFSVKNIGTIATFRRNVSWWFHENSRLLKYTEEALAEGIGTGSLRKGLAYPITHGYVTGRGLAIEGFIVGTGYGGLVYGGYKLGDSFLKDE